MTGTCGNSRQTKSQHGEGRWVQTSPLAELVLVVGGDWEREESDVTGSLTTL